MTLPFEIKLGMEVSHLYLWVHKPSNSSVSALSHTYLLQDGICNTISSSFFILSELCYKKVSVNLLHNKPAFDLACGVSAVQSRLTLAAWRYPCRYCNASAFRLVLSMDRTWKHRWDRGVRVKHEPPAASCHHTPYKVRHRAAVIPRETSWPLRRSLLTKILGKTRMLWAKRVNWTLTLSNFIWAAWIPQVYATNWTPDTC